MRARRSVDGDSGLIQARRIVRVCVCVVDAIIEGVRVCVCVCVRVVDAIIEGVCVCVRACVWGMLL